MMFLQRLIRSGPDPQEIEAKQARETAIESLRRIQSRAGETSAMAKDIREFQQTDDFLKHVIYRLTSRA